jgi:predicted FMN-binding regulatory protein PaiB
MYQPAAFREDRLEVQHALIRAHPLGLLITAGPAGLIANPFPCPIDSEGSDKGTLRLHIARANPQWRELEVVDECLVGIVWKLFSPVAAGFSVQRRNRYRSLNAPAPISTSGENM